MFDYLSVGVIALACVNVVWYLEFCLFRGCLFTCVVFCGLVVFVVLLIELTLLFPFIGIVGLFGLLT